MDRIVTPRRIKDADDLLAMLERLFEGLAATSHPHQDGQALPWNGIALTIANCRTLLADSAQESPAPHASSWIAPQTNSEVETTSLASRIRKAPAMGATVRELGGGGV